MVEAGGSATLDAGAIPLGTDVTTNLAAFIPAGNAGEGHAAKLERLLLLRVFKLRVHSQGFLSPNMKQFIRHALARKPFFYPPRTRAWRINCC
jgi:hypothetical protein